MWAQILNTLIGLWLMIAPSVLNYNDSGTDSCHIVGPIIVTFAFIAFWEATRVVGKWNIPLGLWFIAAPWVLGYEEILPIANDMICGVLVVAFGLVKGKITGSYGGGWQSLWQSNSLHEREAGNEMK